MDLTRQITPILLEDLKRKMVLLAGPRQCGKTTLSRQILEKLGGAYYCWDIDAHRKICAKAGWTSRPIDPSLRYLLQRTKIPYAFQIHWQGEKDWRPENIHGCKIRILPAATFLANLPKGMRRIGLLAVLASACSGGAARALARGGCCEGYL